MVVVPAPVRALLAGWPEVGAAEQAFPFLTVDDAEFPHTLLLSRAELDADDTEIRVVLAGRTTPANLRRTGTAALVAVEGETAHVLKLRLRREVAVDGAIAVALEVASYRPDSLNTPLHGIRYFVTDVLPAIERWDRNRRALALVARTEVES